MAKTVKVLNDHSVRYGRTIANSKVKLKIIDVPVRYGEERPLFPKRQKTIDNISFGVKCHELR